MADNNKMNFKDALSISEEDFYDLSFIEMWEVVEKVREFADVQMDMLESVTYAMLSIRDLSGVVVESAEGAVFPAMVFALAEESLQAVLDSAPEEIRNLNKDDKEDA